MTTTFFRIWLPVSLILHLALLVLVRFLPFTAPQVGGQEFIPISVIEAMQPVEPKPEPPKPEVEPPVVTPVVKLVPPKPTPPDSQVDERLGVPNPRTTNGTGAKDSRKPGNGTGKESTQPGPGKGRTAPPSVMRVKDGTGEAAPPGVNGGTGTGGTELGEGGPSSGAAAKGGPHHGSSKAAGEINENGTVLLTIEVEKDGSIGRITSRGSEQETLVAEAKRLIKAWSYSAALDRGAPVRGSVTMRVRFTDGEYTIEEVK